MIMGGEDFLTPQEGEEEDRRKSIPDDMIR